MPPDPAPTKPSTQGLVNASTITIKPITWIWPGWLAAGKVHILGGQAGAGKSTIGFSLLAQITRGGQWPDGCSAPLGDVLIWSGEDDPSDTIVPRLLAAGGNRSRLWFPGRVPASDGRHRPFDPSMDMAGLTELVRRHSAIKVCMIDPIVSAVSGDSHNNAETRRSLQPVVDFAEATGIAVLGITHFTKGTQGKTPLDRITGSLAFGAVSRVVWGAEEGEGPDDPRKLVRIKTNIGRNGGGFTYTMQQVPVEGMSAQRVVWGAAIEGSAQALLGGGEGQKNKLEVGIELLQMILSSAGNAGVSQAEIKMISEDKDISWPTIVRARANFGDKITPFKVGQASWWRLVVD
jgi:putative DNA primase/helicase